MQAIIDFFTSISDSVSSFISYFVGVLEDMVQMVQMLAMAASDLPQLLAFLPSPIVVMLGTFLTAAILYKVLGREG